MHLKAINIQCSLRDSYCLWLGLEMQRDWGGPQLVFLMSVSRLMGRHEYLM